jgi:enolase-phosphatase E1
VTPLKDLQGFIWREAYQSGNIKGQLFKDVPEVLVDWYKKGIKIYTYSSGSVEAQKLLLEYSDAGNILNYFSGHFDTRIGNKRDSSSYISISSQLQFPPAQILFITDVADEARAAICSGMQSLITIRPGNAQLSQSEMKEFELQTISSLNNITIVN